MSYAEDVEEWKPVSERPSVDWKEFARSALDANQLAGSETLRIARLKSDDRTRNHRDVERHQARAAASPDPVTDRLAPPDAAKLFVGGCLCILLGGVSLAAGYIVGAHIVSWIGISLLAVGLISASAFVIDDGSEG